MPIAGLSAGRAGPSQTPSRASTAMSSSCGNKCAHRRRSIADQREVQQGDGGISDTRTTHRLYRFIKREHIDRVSGS